VSARSEQAQPASPAVGNKGDAVSARSEHAQAASPAVGNKGDAVSARSEHAQHASPAVGNKGDAVHDAAIVATDVLRVYELDGVSVPALRGVSLTVEHGDYLAIVGTSGSGKSTLMHLLGALDRPTGGTLVIGGRDVATLSPSEMARLRNETIGFVFQSFHLLARTTARDNVALPLVYRGVARRERRERADAMLDRVGLAHRVDHRPNQMSGGEQQRVAIARALVTGPSVLLADEPTGNLDSATGRSVLALLESLNAEGVAVVLVTHDREVAGRAHRQIVMRDGLIVADALEPDAVERGAP
jgi:putative ABC transport system ATP-binding protein